ncbi:MAG: ABC transporter ATP-binding protein [Acidobacteria bacterium]|nr:ABC transporter ATP-binding protein [Acidobacteriota bacterium]
METLVSLRNVSRRYPMDHTFVRALDDVSLDVRRGEFLAVAGPSGSGKSTLLNLIGCIDQPSGGSISIEGVEATRLKPSELAALRRRKIGFVFQTFNLIPVFTAFENVEYPLLLDRQPPAERRRRVMEVLESVGLGYRANHRPDLLSGGERQRVAVARAVVHRPALVLADEATANLDTHNATQLIDLMRRLNRDLKVTFLFSTHDQRLLDRADRVLWLCDGRLTEEEPGREVPHETVSAARL